MADFLFSRWRPSAILACSRPSVRPSARPFVRLPVRPPALSHASGQTLWQTDNRILKSRYHCLEFSLFRLCQSGTDGRSGEKIKSHIFASQYLHTPLISNFWLTFLPSVVVKDYHEVWNVLWWLCSVSWRPVRMWHRPMYFHVIGLQRSQRLRRFLWWTKLQWDILPFVITAVLWWVCLCVCLSVCPRGYLRNHTRDL